MLMLSSMGKSNSPVLESVVRSTQLLASTCFCVGLVITVVMGVP